MLGAEEVEPEILFILRNVVSLGEKFRSSIVVQKTFLQVRSSIVVKKTSLQVNTMLTEY